MASGYEPVDDVQVTVTPLSPGWGYYEPSESDPVIISKPDDNTLMAGRGVSFLVQYQATHDVVIVVHPPFHRQHIHRYSRSGDIRIDIPQPTHRHRGTFEVKIWDPSLKARTGGNPAETSWRVHVLEQR